MSKENVSELLAKVGVEVEIIKPWGGHEPDPQATRYIVQIDGNETLDDANKLLSEIPTLEKFIYRIEVDMTDGTRRVIADAGVSKYSGKSASSPARAMEIGIGNIKKSLIEAECMRLTTETILNMDEMGSLILLHKSPPVRAPGDEGATKSFR